MPSIKNQALTPELNSSEPVLGSIEVRAVDHTLCINFHDQTWPVDQLPGVCVGERVYCLESPQGDALFVRRGRESQQGIWVSSTEIMIRALLSESRRSDGKTGLTRARAAQLLDICGLGQEQTAHGQYQATHPAGQAAGTASFPIRLSPLIPHPRPDLGWPAAAHNAAQTQPAGSAPGSPLDDRAAAAAAPIRAQGEGRMPSGLPDQSPAEAPQSPAGAPGDRRESALSGGGGLWTDETYQLLALMNKMQAIVLNRLIADEAHANDLFGGAL